MGTQHWPREARVAINGVSLDEGQVMALRAAVSGMLTEVRDPEHAAKLGPIAAAYEARLAEVENMLVRGAR